MSDLLMVYITNPTLEKAQALAQHLLENRLIACANMMPVHSAYRWEGKIVSDEEVVLICKTTTAVAPLLVQAVEAIHPYEVPSIVQIPIQANMKYAAFVRGAIE